MLRKNCHDGVDVGDGVDDVVNGVVGDGVNGVVGVDDVVDDVVDDGVVDDCGDGIDDVDVVLMGAVLEKLKKSLSTSSSPASASSYLLQSPMQQIVAVAKVIEENTLKWRYISWFASCIF